MVTVVQDSNVSVRAYVNGRICYWDGIAENWRWEDNDLLATGSQAVSRECPKCGLICRYGAADPCIGMIHGAASACCGHGVHAGYINWPGVSAPAGWWRNAYLIETKTENKG